MTLPTYVSPAPVSAAAAVDALLSTSGLPVTEQERESLIANYPQIRALGDSLRIPEIRYAEPALIYGAADGLEGKDIYRLQLLEALFTGGTTPPEILQQVNPYVEGFEQQMATLRQLSLGEVQPFGVMLAGGEH